MVIDLHPHRKDRLEVGLDSALEGELGLDSLSRMELLARIERAYGRGLSERAVAAAETPRDLLRALAGGAPVPSTGGAPAPAPAPPSPALGRGERAVPLAAVTLVDALEWHVERHHERVHLHLHDEDGTVLAHTYGALYTGAREVAGGLAEQGIGPGSAVALMLPTGLDYFHAFVGVLLLGAVPVPIYPPARPSQLEDHLRRHAAILDNARVEALVTFDQAHAVARLLAAQVPRLRRVATVDALRSAESARSVSRVAATDTALLQYTSGSTGQPKGVVLSHANLLASVRAMAEAVHATPDDVFVSWLPLYHDMGLIGAWLGSLYLGMPLAVMSPLAFLARPARWLQAIHNHRGTLSGAPNFAYELCVRRIADDELTGLDLSAWRLAFNGAEPVSADTMRRFAERFAPYGLDPRALTPVYGLAEATLGVAFTPLGRGARFDRVDRGRLTRTGRADPAAGDDGDTESVELVSSGVPIPGFEVRTVDDAGRETAERVVGRIEFRGPAATSGYLHAPEATRALFDGAWLHTGDLGYVADGELYVTGRTKDILIRAGRNVYPYELEEAVADVEGVRRGCVAVIGVGDPSAGTERLVVIAETRDTEPGALERMRDAIARCSAELVGLPPDDVVLAPPHTVLKTSSGKIRRSAMRELYEQGRLGVRGRGVWLQVARVTASAVRARLRRGLERLGELAHAARAWAVLVPLAVTAWVGVALLGTEASRWRLIRRLARAALWLTGTPLTVEGTEHVAGGRPCVLVSNHQSYLDGVVLVAALPGPVRFVAKRELASQAVAGPFLRRIGCRFVERFDAAQSAADARETAREAGALPPMLVFAEGTLHRMAGLLPFQLGAFSAAVEAGVAVVPVTLRGTRSMLRGDSLFPRSGRARVVLAAPIEPSGSGWEGAVRLRDRVRGEILRRVGEPDLADRRPLLELKSRGR
ncbi:MAG: AMP-binding protein [Ectothiorhodospiraceae bacterium]|nr:AMP-binding protein [Chromatiales bacterium]MCP5155035.1 AMP-binding protein [Ectothiorhodospiraceae bacterium]